MATPELSSCRWLIAGLLVLTSGLLPTRASAQMSAPQLSPGNPHYLFSADMPPGMVGAARLQRRGAVQGYYQPVRFAGPQGIRFALAEGNGFAAEGEPTLRAGLLVGAVYRFKITRLPDAPGRELFPTIEIIDRTYPPAGQATRFPIPIVLEEDDLEQALAGRLVTRVIYLEDPQTALPVAQQPDESRAIDIGSEQDPLQTADRFGRPVAIIRIGSLTAPNSAELLPQFCFGSPPWYPLTAPRTEAEIPDGESAAVRTPHIPRNDLAPAAPPRVARPLVPRMNSQTTPANNTWLR
jgi:hypothetical protein